MVVALLLVLLPAVSVAARPIHPDDISLPDGYKIELAVDNLAAPSMAGFDDQGRMLIAETGYGGAGEPKVTRIEKDGTRTVLVAGGAFGEEVPVTSVASHEGKVYVVHAGTVSIVDDGGQLVTVISGLPGQGDHQANQLIFKDGHMYLSIGTVTNSGVVGPDNAVFGWLKKPANRQLHDVPCRDITLTGEVFESENPIGDTPPERVKTSAYAPFGTELPPGAVIKGDVKCNGAVLRARPDGSDLQVVAWGFRNPYGLEVGADGALYVAMHGFDARGSRPVENAWDSFYKVEEGKWYGWPDYASGVPVTDPQFKTKDNPQPRFLIANHPTDSLPKEIARFNPHAAINGFGFAPSEEWGKPTDAFIAQFGDFTPATGTVDQPQGVKVVKLDTTNGQVTDFITNKLPGQASRRGTGGLEHPSDVAFGPDGAMYITDWGVARISVEGIKLEENSGVVWKVTPAPRSSLPGGPSLLYTILGSLALAGATVFAGWGGASGRALGPARRPLDGLWTGALAGLVMGLFTMTVAAAALQLPWYAAPRVLATIVMGSAAVANILEFEIVSFIVGVIVLLVLTAILGLGFTLLLRTHARWRQLLAGLLFGLTAWALLQYFVLPILFPLVTEKGFPPLWYAMSFGVFGFALGALLAYLPLVRPGAKPPLEERVT
jgi:glucose/arabinose dehydrogenase